MAITKRTAKIMSACSGIMASMTKDSSPEEAIIMATRAPKLNILWVYRETVAKPPIQPGIDPRSAPMTTCPTFVRRSPLKNRPLDSMFSDSIIIIITTTRPVISIELRSMSINKCILSIYAFVPRLFDPACDEQVYDRTKRGVCCQSDD